MRFDRDWRTRHFLNAQKPPGRLALPWHGRYATAAARSGVGCGQRREEVPKKNPYADGNGGGSCSNVGFGYAGGCGYSSGGGNGGGGANGEGGDGGDGGKDESGSGSIEAWSQLRGMGSLAPEGHPAWY